ncbi:MAG: polyprenol monophosphomannose synthase [Deltaproteobacteria bacterium]|nr:MAG: polyprenol monophosphomannose synthase [Deltaproteobacteria bacterium]
MKVFVTIPTFNESENIERLIAEVRRQDQRSGIVVADDDSPDGTWKIVQRISESDPGVFLLRRTANKGRGAAGVDAFRFALDQHADVVIEMDADFSHDPKHIPSFLERIKKFDVVLGSRSIANGQDLRSSPLRKWVTSFSSFYARTVLGLPVRDCNSGYRCFRREVLESVDLPSFRSTGPSIVQELLYKAHVRGFSIVEIPIVFTERRAGKSNLNFSRLLQGFLMVLRLKWLHILGRLWE